MKVLSVGALIAALLVICYALWDPSPSTGACFNRNRNGLWLGHSWYTGFDVKTRKPVTLAECDNLVALMHANGIRYAYIHAGPIKDDGSIADSPGSLFYHLKSIAPDVVWLPWLGGDARKLHLCDSAWRSRFLETLGALHTAGFGGVHLDIEPITDRHPGYAALLREIRNKFEGGFFISHATRRIGPWGRAPLFLEKFFWSQAFYRETMASADQTVLMGYDTMLPWSKPYIAYVKFETGRLLEWARGVNRNHTVVIGVPSYEDMPLLSHPHVENIKNAVWGVRAALEEVDNREGAFEGVAVYAHWVTDSAEWKQFGNYWLCKP
jgi:hypothetical protein